MRLLIAGAGGHARVVADAALATGRFTQVSFLDDRCPESATPSPWPIIGRLSDLGAICQDFDSFIPAFGDARLRLELLEKALAVGIDCESIVHPRATLSPYASVGVGSILCAGSIVAVGAAIGDGCIINTAATVDHDCSLGRGVNVCPGAHIAGSVAIGARTWLGIGAVAKQGIQIGADVVVGAGAVCVANIRDGVTVVGVPAREVNKIA